MQVCIRSHLPEMALRQMTRANGTIFRWKLHVSKTEENMHQTMRQMIRGWSLRARNKGVEKEKFVGRVVRIIVSAWNEECVEEATEANDPPGALRRSPPRKVSSQRSDNLCMFRIRTEIVV